MRYGHRVVVNVTSQTLIHTLCASVPPAASLQFASISAYRKLRHGRWVGAAFGRRVLHANAVIYDARAPLCD